MKLNATLDRHRRLLLIVTALLTAMVLAARLRGFDRDHLAVVLAVPLGAAILLILTLMIASVGHQPTFLVDEAARAFSTPPSGILPLAGVAHVAVLGLVLLYPPAFWNGTFLDRIELPAVIIAFLLYGRMLIRGETITLTPEGVHADKGRGSLSFPWDALDPANPPVVDTGEIDLAYARPDLVRTTGLVAGSSSLTVSNVGLPMLAAALRHYLAHPAERAGIGTPAGHERLLQAIAAEPPVVDDDEDEDDDEPWTRAEVVRLAIAVLVGFVTFVLVGSWIETAAGDDSAPVFFYRVIFGAAVTAAIGYAFRVIKGYRRNRRQ